MSPPIQPAQAQRRWMICFRGPGPIERTGGTRYTPHVRSSSTMHYTRAYRAREVGDSSCGLATKKLTAPGVHRLDGNGVR